MSYKIVSDSSSNMFGLAGIHYTTVPMKVLGAKEYVDTPELDLAGMVAELKEFKSKSGSSCPNVQEWIDAFGDADEVYAVTISRNLSGSYNSAKQAAETYMDENPGKKAYGFASFSAGPEMAMMAEKIAEYAAAGCDFDTVVEKVEAYQNRVHTLFSLESLTNLARNGRVNPTVAKIAGVLGIRVIGDAQSGQIIPAHKVRGHKKAMQTIVDMMEDKLLISALDWSFDECEQQIHRYGGLCVPAHINRGSNGVLNALGFLPGGAKYDALEVSDAVAMPPIDMTGYRTLRSSDAHYLENILEPTFTLEVREKSTQGIFDAIAGR